MADEKAGKKPARKVAPAQKKTKPKAQKSVVATDTGCSTRAGTTARATTSTATGHGSRAGGAAR